MGLMYSLSLTRSEMVRLVRGTTCASSRSGNVDASPEADLIVMGSAPSADGLNRPPWRIVWSADL